MVSSCTVCYATSENSKSVSFHRFPQNEARKKKWMEILGLNDREKPVCKTHKVCSKHFSPESYSLKAKKKILKLDAVPISYDQIMEALRIVRQRHGEIPNTED